MISTGKNEIEAATSLIDWWRTMGVDTAISETPNLWLSDNTATITPKVVAQAFAPVHHATLETLVEALMHDTAHDASASRERVGPSGAAGSELMILTDFPDPADVAAGQLLSDPIFARMIDAIGRTRDTVYIASLCAGRPVTGRLSDDDIAAVSGLAKQHVALASPKYLWLVGRAASRAMLGLDDVAARGKLHHFNYDGGTALAVATAHPRMFEGSKARKAAAWTEMQRLLIKDDV